MSRVDHFIIRQKVEKLEAITGYETTNKYDVFDKEGQQIFTVVEDTATFTRLLCCGPCRSFNMFISDMQGQKVMQLVKPFSQQVKVTGTGSVGSETVMGCVIGDEWSCLPKFMIKNEFGKTILIVDGPCAALGCCSCGGDFNFTLTSPDNGQEVFINL